MTAFLKTFALAFLLIQGAQSKDHSSHNCCLLTAEGWIPRNDWTKAVCEERWGSVATFDGVKCIQKPGSAYTQTNKSNMRFIFDCLADFSRHI
ncbi:hypothetical protein CSPX01_09169 [Colletotrichum filicis]|nr:hypothetical protein CSPX01_09169 [Colletotrichum filicis]